MPDSLLHRLTHRIPGVPEHGEHRPHPRNRPSHHRSHHRSRNHDTGRPPRVLAAWQRRIAAFFGRNLP
ncbi:hypothetical protein ACQP2P_40015 [Dactylosporangium sp. CA-139114]|uniref:hypothetical protein n=1 Tax=Dactylosporangium sp. CA-139114 TaxID=3239931 RepID=UPI003D98578D